MTNQTEQTITIPFKEYMALKLAELELECLDEGGVDNWDWHGDAMAHVRERKDEVQRNAESRLAGQLYAQSPTVLGSVEWAAFAPDEIG